MLTSTSPRVAHGRRTIPLYWASFLIVGLSLSVLGPALSELRSRSGAGIGAIGILFVGQSAGYVVGSFVGGQLYDRFHGHRVFALSFAAMAVGLLSIPLADSLAFLFLAFAVVGIGAATADVGGNTLLLWQLGAASLRSMNVLHLCFGLGALSAPLFVHIGLDLAVRGAAIGGLAIAGWALVVTTPTVRTPTVEQHNDPSPRLLALLATFFFLYVGVELAFAGWIFTYGEEIEFSDLAATWLTATFWIGFTAGRILASVFAHRFRPKVQLIASCSATLAVAVALLIGHGHPPTVWVGTALIGLAAGPQFPVMLSYLERRIHVTGYATSWFVGAAGLGGLAFPWLVGQWFDASGAWALPAATVLLAAAALGSFAASNRVLGG